MTKGEQKIANILHNAGIAYETEKTFADCGRGKYRFDFWLPRYRVLIEYDGEAHFHQHAFGMKKSEWQRYTAHDRFKNSWALAHDIKLYRVPYWDIENISSYNDIISNISYLVKFRSHNDDLRRSKNLD